MHDEFQPHEFGPVQYWCRPSLSVVSVLARSVFVPESELRSLSLGLHCLVSVLSRSVLAPDLDPSRDGLSFRSPRLDCEVGHGIR